MFIKDSGKLIDLEAPFKSRFQSKELELVTIDDKILLYNDSMYAQFCLCEYVFFSGHWKYIESPKFIRNMTVSCVF